MRSLGLLSLAVAAITPPLLAIPPASACSGSLWRTYEVDPVYEFYTQWSYDEPACQWYGNGFPISCDATPLVQIGGPTPINGYREGAYIYDCNLFLGAHMDQGAYVSGPGAGSVCQTVPPVFVLGEQVPGTGQQYCTPPIGSFYQSVPADTPNSVRSQGYFRVYWDPLGGYYSYTYFDVGQAITTCFGAGNDEGLNNGRFLLPGALDVWFLNCRA